MMYIGHGREFLSWHFKSWPFVKVNNELLNESESASLIWISTAQAKVYPLQSWHIENTS